MKSISKLFIFGFLPFILETTLFAQQPTFTSVFYDLNGEAQGYSIIKSFDSNYIVVGERDGQGLVLKMDPLGNIQWDKKFSFPDYTVFTRIISTDDSCFVICGTTNNYDMLCVKISHEGDTIWSELLDFGSFDYAASVCQTIDKGFILAGFSDNLPSNPPYSLIAIAKLDSNGNLQWAFHLSGATIFNQIYSVKPTPDGGCIAMGDLADNYGGGKAALIKLASNGAISWARQLEALPLTYSEGFDVLITSTEMFCYADVAEGGASIIKTDLSGNVLWGRSYEVSSQDFTNSIPRSSLRNTSDGGFSFVTSGQYGSLLKVDSAGNLIWQSNLSFNNVDGIESFDQGYLVVGNGPLYGVDMAPTLNPQIGIIKIDSLGNSIDCVEPSWGPTLDCMVEFIPVSITYTATGTIFDLHPVISNSSLTLYSGCVAVTGSISKDNTPRSDLIVYPNPATDLVTFRFYGELPDDYFNIKLCDLCGNQVTEGVLPKGKPEIALDTRNLMPGIYFYGITSNKYRQSGKLIIVK